MNSKSRAVRLPNELWQTIEAEAEASDMSVNELVGRRLRKSFSRVDENRKTVENHRETDADVEFE